MILYYINSIRRAQSAPPSRTTLLFSELMAGPKRQWKETLERTADENYPDWRELFQKTGKRLPHEMRKKLELRSFWEAERPAFTKAMLTWLGAKTDPEVVAELSPRLDAVVEFTIFVAREFLVGNHSPEKHHSDVFDQFQLQYLAMDRFVIVTADPDLSKKSQHSPQAARIMSFDRFLQTL
jgi:hypothetical protein